MLCPIATWLDFNFLDRLVFSFVQAIANARVRWKERWHRSSLPDRGIHTLYDIRFQKHFPYIHAALHSVLEAPMVLGSMTVHPCPHQKETTQPPQQHLPPLY